MIVAISGLHGAGKTTIAQELAKKFNLRYVCAGAAFRRLAEEHGMSLEEFSRYAELHPEIDREIDQRTVDAAKGGDVLIDAMLAGWMAEDADIKILLSAPLEVRARRISERERRSFGEVLEETRERERSESERFKRLYGIDINDSSPFDLLLNTERWSAEEASRLIELAIELAVAGGRRRDRGREGLR